MQSILENELEWNILSPGPMEENCDYQLIPSPQATMQCSQKPWFGSLGFLRPAFLEPETK